MELNEEYKEWLHLRYGEEADRLLVGHESLTKEEWFQRMESAQENDPRMGPSGSGNTEQSRITLYPFIFYSKGLEREKEIINE